MIKHLALIALALSIAAVGLTACGGDDDEDQIRDVVQQFIDADQEVCGKLTDELLNEQFDGREACEEATQEEGAAFEAEIESVEIDGDRADVRLNPEEGESGTIGMVKEDGDWLIASIEEDTAADEDEGGAEDTSTTEEPATPEAPADEELAVQGTVDAFVTAVREEDPQVLCGLLTPRFAAELVGGGDPDTAIAQCVQVFRMADLSALKRDAAGLEVQDVTISGNTATAAVSGGETFSLVKQDGRWVIDQFGIGGE